MKYFARNEVILKNGKHIQPGETVELDDLKEVEAFSSSLELVKETNKKTKRGK